MGIGVDGRAMMAEFRGYKKGSILNNVLWPGLAFDVNQVFF